MKVHLNGGKTHVETQLHNDILWGLKALCDSAHSIHFWSRIFFLYLFIAIYNCNIIIIFIQLSGQIKSLVCMHAYCTARKYTTWFYFQKIWLYEFHNIFSLVIFNLPKADKWLLNFSKNCKNMKITRCDFIKESASLLIVKYRMT